MNCCRNCGKEDRLTVVSQGPVYHFVPSNPWVAVGWRKRGDIEVDLVDVMKRKGIRLLTQGAQRVNPAENRIELDGRRRRSITTIWSSRPDPELAFDEIPGLGPRRPYPVDLPRRPRFRTPRQAFEKLAANPGPDRHRRRAGRLLLRPGLRIPVHPGNRAAPAQAPRPRADDLRHLRALYRPSRSRRGRRHQGPARKRDARQAHQMDHQCPRQECRAGQDVGRRARRRRLGPQDPRSAVRLFDDAARLSRRRRRSRHREARQSPRLRHRRQVSAQSGISKHLRDRRLRGDCARRRDPRSGRRAENRLHDRIDGDGDRAATSARCCAASDRSAQPTWNAICLADFGDSGVAFLAQPQIPPRNVNWSSKGEWVHYAKVAFEKYFLRKIRRGESEPFYERFLLDKLNIAKVKEVEPAA